MPLLKLTARLLGLVVDTLIGLAAVPMLAIGASRVMPTVAEAEVNTGAVIPIGVIEKIFPVLEVRVISFAVILFAIVRFPVVTAKENSSLVVKGPARGSNVLVVADSRYAFCALIAIRSIPLESSTGFEAEPILPIGASRVMPSVAEVEVEVIVPLSCKIFPVLEVRVISFAVILFAIVRFPVVTAKENSSLVVKGPARGSNVLVVADSRYAFCALIAIRSIPLESSTGFEAEPILPIGASRVMPSVAEVEVEVIVPLSCKIFPVLEVRVISFAVILFAIVRFPVVTAKENSSLVVKGPARGSNVLVVADSRYAFCALIAIRSIPLLLESSTGFEAEPILPIGASRVMPSVAEVEVEVIVPLSCKIFPVLEVRVISFAVILFAIVRFPVVTAKENSSLVVKGPARGSNVLVVADSRYAFCALIAIRSIPLESSTGFEAEPILPIGASRVMPSVAEVEVEVIVPLSCKIFPVLEVRVISFAVILFAIVRFPVVTAKENSSLVVKGPARGSNVLVVADSRYAFCALIAIRSIPLESSTGFEAEPILPIGASRVMPSVAEVEVEVIVPLSCKIFPVLEVRVISFAVILFAIVRFPVVTAKENSSLVVKGPARGSNVLVVADSRYAFCALIAIRSIPLESSTGFEAEPILPIGASRVMPSVAEVEVEVIVPLSCKIFPVLEVRVISFAVILFAIVRFPVVTAKENSSLVVKGPARGSNVLVVADSRYAFCALIAIRSIPLESSTGFEAEPILPIGASRVMPSVAEVEVEVIVPLSCKIFPVLEVRVISFAVILFAIVRSPVVTAKENSSLVVKGSARGSRGSNVLVVADSRYAFCALIAIGSIPLLPESSTGFEAEPILPIRASRVMPLAEVEVIVPPVCKILPAREVRVISLAVMPLTMVMSPISAVIEITPVMFVICGPGSRGVSGWSRSIVPDLPRIVPSISRVATDSR